MGLGLPRAIVNEKDLSHYVDTVIKGVSCVSGITERGPVGKPMLVSSEMQYARIFGGELKHSDFPLICKRALSYGAVLWLSRVAHYTDVTDASTLTAKTSSVILEDRDSTTPASTLKISASSPGIWGDGLRVEVIESSLDPENLFTIRVLEGDEVLDTLSDVSMDEDSEYHVEKFKSAYIVVEDLESGSENGEDRPALGIFTLTGGRRIGKQAPSFVHGGEPAQLLS